MYFGDKKIPEERKEKLCKLLQPLFTYHEIIDRQERFEINNESALEKASREYSFLLAKEYHRKILKELDYQPICEERETLRVIYDKMYKQLTLPVNEQDWTYDYLCLVNACRKILN